MRRSALPLVCCATFAACAAPGATREGELREQVEQLRAELARHEARVEELSNRVFVLFDRVDSAQVELSRAAGPTLEVVKLQPPEDAAPVESGSGEPAFGDEPAVVIRLADDGELEALPVREVPPAPAASAGGAEEVFRSALSAYRQGQVEEAYQGFARFARAFPRHAYADNAVYWMGECRFDAKEYRAAIAEFDQVLRRYPRSNKVPDALLKMGLAYERLGEREMAVRAFRDVVTSYPKSALADLARTHLQALSTSGGSR